jgi:enoyl-CoA hydratase/carnithine racemase
MAFVDYEKNGSISVVTLKRPERLNALGSELVSDLEGAWKRFENDAEARVAILTGSGRSFSSGEDLKDVTQLAIKMGTSTNHVNEIMKTITKPIIVAINGIALGGGVWVLVLNCDVRIAAASATFGMPEIVFGIPVLPELFLAQNIPLCAVMELILTNDRMTAKRAYDIGLVNKVVPDEELMRTAIKIADMIAKLSPWAVQLVKQARLRAVEVFDEVWKVNQSRQDIRSELSRSDEHREALRALLKE